MPNEEYKLNKCQRMEADIERLMAEIPSEYVEQRRMLADSRLEIEHQRFSSALRIYDKAKKLTVKEAEVASIYLRAIRQMEENNAANDPEFEDNERNYISRMREGRFKDALKNAEKMLEISNYPKKTYPLIIKVNTDLIGPNYIEVRNISDSSVIVKSLTASSDADGFELDDMMAETLIPGAVSKYNMMIDTSKRQQISVCVRFEKGIETDTLIKNFSIKMF